MRAAVAVELPALDCVDELVDELVDDCVELADADNVCELLAAVDELANAVEDNVTPLLADIALDSDDAAVSVDCDDDDALPVSLDIDEPVAV